MVTLTFCRWVSCPRTATFQSEDRIWSHILTAGEMSYDLAPRRVRWEGQSLWRIQRSIWDRCAINRPNPFVHPRETAQRVSNSMQCDLGPWPNREKKEKA